MDGTEAIKELTQWRNQMKSHGVPNYGKKLTALDLAIEALREKLQLSGETSTNEGVAESATTTDCISRQQAIEAFCNDCRALKPGQCEHWDKCRSQKVLRSLPPVTPTERTGEWIPTSEMLPKAEDMYQPPEQRYLCQLEAYGERKFCVLSRLKGAVSPFWDWYGVAVHDYEVTAWMPLPEIYRSEGENK